MDRPKFTGSNRYALLCDNEEMDLVDVVERSTRQISLQDEAKLVVDGQVKVPVLEKEAQQSAPLRAKGNTSKHGMKSTSTVRENESTQHSNQKNEPVGFRERNQNQDVKQSNRQNTDKSQMTSLPEKSEDWNETQKKVRPFKGRGGMPRRDQFNERGKREFDRLSGSQKSGVKPVAKRDGGGAHNWGRLNDNYEVLAEDDHNTDVVADSTESKIAAMAPKGDEKSVKLLTLDEWKEQEKSSHHVPAYNLRKPGEGSDPKQWDKYHHVLKKKTQEEKPSFEEVTHAHVVNQPKASSKSVPCIDVQFSDKSYSSARNTGRGGRRGSKPSDAPLQSAHTKESSMKKQATPKFDEADFPSLGGT